MVEPLVARRGDYVGLFLVALSTLMLEILLTRIFSVTMYYHLAFVAVSIAMFGMTFGAVIVYLFPKVFRLERTRANLSLSSLAFAVAAVVCLWAHLSAGVAPGKYNVKTLFMAYGIVAVPFVFSGIAVSLALSQFPRQISRLYAVDLIGAALGCVLLIGALEFLGGLPAVFFVALLAAVAARCFAAETGSGLTLGSAGVCVVLCVLLVFELNASPQSQLLRIPAAKDELATGEKERPVLYEKWNSYSRVTIRGTPESQKALEDAFGWGFPDSYKPEPKVRQLQLRIDSSASTVLTGLDGSPEALEFLRHDVTNIGHHVLKDAKVFVIGAGGGRDVLSALAFGQKEVVAVEMNLAIIQAVNDRFGDFTGHLDRKPNVKFINDEARSYLSRSRDQFDLIQISLIDTWASTAAGAYVLSENTLYTTDGWKIFLEKLTPTGMLSVSRWYMDNQPWDAHRLLALATASLTQAGISSPRQHLVMVVKPDERPGIKPAERSSVLTLLVRETPFSDADIQKLSQVAGDLKFQLPLTPTKASDPIYEALTDPARVAGAIAASAEDISAPTDDRPFFFNRTAKVLIFLLLFVIGLTAMCIVLPVVLRTESGVLYREPGLTTAFAGIGVAFMLVEIAQIQRLIVLLGHPTFSLSVALFGLLIASGLGSACTQRVMAPNFAKGAGLRLAGLLAVLAAIGLVTPSIVGTFATASTPVRILAALLLVMPPGFFMGMCFPISMKIAAARRPSIAPWLWGINGALSVCASVVAVMISTRLGISVTWWVGVGCYVVAGLAIMSGARWVDRQPVAEPAKAEAATA